MTSADEFSELGAVSDEAAAAALARFAADVRRAYGPRLAGLYLFGSRARGDHGRDSDVDVAVVLRDSGWRFWPEMRSLADIAFPHELEWGVAIHPCPISLQLWEDPRADPQAGLVRNAQQDARWIESS